MNGLGRKKEENENKNLVFTRETLGVVLILFSTLMLVCLITREAVFSVIGQAVNAFLFGAFGFFSYAVIFSLIILGVLLVCDRKTGVTLRVRVLATFAFITIAIIAQIATAPVGQLEYAQYLSACFQMGEGGSATSSASGAITALVAYFFQAFLTPVGSYIVLGVVFAILAYSLVKAYLKQPIINVPASKKFRSSFVEEQGELGVDIAGVKDYPVEDVDFSTVSGKQKLFINDPNSFAVKNKREISREQTKPSASMKISFSDGGLGVVESQASQPKSAFSSNDFKQKLDYIRTPASIDVTRITNQGDTTSGTTVSAYVKRTEEKNQQTVQPDIPFINHSQPTAEITQSVEDSVQARASRFENIYAEVNDVEIENPTVIEDEVFRPVTEDISKSTEIEQPVVDVQPDFDIPFIDESDSVEDQCSFIEQEKEQVVEPIESEEYNDSYCSNEQDEHEQDEQEVQEEQEEQLPPTTLGNSRRLREIFMTDKKEEPEVEEKPAFTSRVIPDNNLGGRRNLGFEAKEEQPEPEQKKEEKPAPPINRKYYRPPFDLLETYTQPINAVQENHQERMEIIQRTLEEFHINAVPQSYVQGPSVTRYEIMMPAGISVRKVLAYDDDLKMRLAAKDGVRIEAPIPGKNLVGIEVANSVKVTVGLKEVMQGLAGKNAKPTALMFAIGKDIVGNSISYDLAKGPHYLIAGATGSGKSVALHVMIVSLLMRYSPEELKLVLVDPKSVEFRKYEHIPHLLVDEIITEPKRALTLLQWAYDETNRRNEMFTECGGMISNIDDYNTQIANDKIAKLPRIVFIIDELADLMEACKKDLEEKIRRIAAKSRSAGIHLVLATQRPSVDVITGTIKANLPSRIALKVMNFADSQTILGGAGAEKLLGNGDMLYKDSSMGDYERYQGAYISGREVTNIVNYIKEHNKAYFDDGVQEFLDKETKPKQEESSIEGGGEESGELNDLMLKALWLAVNTQSVSISSLQRRFQIGYARAGGLVDKMEQMGFVSPNEGSKARRVLITKEEFLSRFGPIDEAEL